MTRIRHPRPHARRLLRALRPSLFTSLLSLGLIGAGTGAHALDTQFSAPKAPEDLTERLEGASASLALGDGAELQEVLAAALSDYRTLVQVLYDAGYFAPVVNIRLDGREAANINLLSPPRDINQVAITVDPGPAFTFGRAEVTPLPTTEPAQLPEGFAPAAPPVPASFKRPPPPD